MKVKGFSPMFQVVISTPKKIRLFFILINISFSKLSAHENLSPLKMYSILNPVGLVPKVHQFEKTQNETEESEQNSQHSQEKKSIDEIQIQQKSFQKNLQAVENPSLKWENPLPVFNLEYDISLSGISCGKMTFELVQKSEKSPHFRAQQVWNSQIFFFHLDQSEVSHFLRTQKELLAQSYSFKRDKSGDKKLYTYFFTEHSHNRNKSDRLSLQLWLIDHLAKHPQSLDNQEVTIVDDKGEVKIFPTVSLESELISVKFDFKGRYHEIIFDKSRHYLPVSFTQKRGALTFEGRLSKHDVNLNTWWYP